LKADQIIFSDSAPISKRSVLGAENADSFEDWCQAKAVSSLPYITGKNGIKNTQGTVG